MNRVKLIVLVLLAILSSASDEVPGGPLVTEETWNTKAPTYSVGSAVWYAPGVMEDQMWYRGYSYNDYVDGVAMMSPADIGETVWLRRPHHLEWEGPFIVVDCAMRGDMYDIVTTRYEVVEVGWRTASRWGLGPHNGGWRLDAIEVLVGPVPLRHGSRDPLDNAQLHPVDYVRWFLAMAKLDA